MDIVSTMGDLAVPAGRLRCLHRRRTRLGGFSLVELMVATLILGIILAIIFSITQMISKTWGQSSAKIEAFQGGRAAFEALSRQISQATLNTYYDYFDAAGLSRSESIAAGNTGFNPARYGRYSDLHFISGKSLLPNQIGHAIFFSSPMGYTDDTTYSGMKTLLNGCGFYVTYDKDHSVPDFLASLPNKPPDRYRFRLMQYLQPSQDLKVYAPPASGVTAERDWFLAPLGETAPPVGILAENAIALILLPKLSEADAADAASAGAPDDLAPVYEYDTRDRSAALSQYQLPPVVEAVMVVIDETSAQRFCGTATMPDFGLSGGINGLFQKSDELNDDLDTLTDALSSQNVGYRIFRSQVALRGAKWSSTP